MEFSSFGISQNDVAIESFIFRYTSNEQALKVVPYSIFLIDRVEDALPSDFNALMQLLDCCTMTDQHGRKVIFSCCIVMIASRAGNKDFIEKLVHRKFSARFNGNVLGQVLYVKCSQVIIFQVLKFLITMSVSLLKYSTTKNV